MSGGYFDYRQYRLEEFASEIDRVIAGSGAGKFDGYGERAEVGFTDATLDRFREAAHTLRRAGDMMQRIDWLLSCDDGELTFHERWEGGEVRGPWSV
jgi:hypothetical protein